MGPPLPIDVHDEGDDWPEMKILLELVAKERDGMEPVGITIPTGAALVVRPDGELLSWGKKLCEKRRIGRGGAWKVEEIPSA
jgi:hypothetical protein